MALADFATSPLESEDILTGSLKRASVRQGYKRSGHDREHSREASHWDAEKAAKKETPSQRADRWKEHGTWVERILPVNMPAWALLL